ncbi:hypothetical protein [Candidatus Pelagibacter bacterium nBUS_25]|uniref:hypothetical protein n=1 Tax=Candidatus Pelagibacter bacterium nBUS_25 TaxID=3374187 RepID=UPI003EBDA3A4
MFNSKKLVINIKNQLSKNLNLDFNLSNNYSYNLFPKPNFKFENGSFLNGVKNSGEIKIYVSPKYLLFPNKIKIEKVIFDKMNFNLNKENYNFFIELLNNDFSNFTLKVKNSNIFYKNIENDVLFINKIDQLKYLYDTKNFENILLADNKIFNIPYKIEIRNDTNKKKIISKINLDFINLYIENNLNYLNDEKDGFLKVIYNQNKGEGKYILKKNSFKFNFYDRSLDQNFKYNGFINLKPFFSELSGNLNRINLDELLNSNSILAQLLKTGLLNNKNLNINANIITKKATSLKDLINLSLNVKISEGLVDINETKFSLKNYADIKITDSLLYANNNNLTLDALISINVKDFNEVYRILQTPRNNRKEIKKIEFRFNYNFDQMIAKLSDIKVDETINQKVNKTLNQIILKDNNLQNKIYLKSLINQAMNDYVG